MKLLNYVVRTTPNGLRLRVEVEDSAGRRRTLECHAPADESKHPRAVLDLLALAEEPKRERTQEEYDGGFELIDPQPWVMRFK
jgi:hypothetical protein